MDIVFYLLGLIAIAGTIRIITHTNPMHALLYLIVVLFAISGIFFSIGAYFAGALEVIIYSGAIAVLFVFVVMMLNIGKILEKQERVWTKLSLWIGPGLLSLLLFIILIISIFKMPSKNITGKILDAKLVGISLFSYYLLVTELASILLLGGLIVSCHIGRINKSLETFRYLLTKNKITEKHREKK
ncbi:NADH-quinone oxidoreductase subunit J [Candidatus Ecksteinia adelgidicola]|nr:NADH-quinone oxidoreductase subunit J [Candidatus Ecksteinia adelgidicola]